MKQETECFRSELEDLIERYGDKILRFCYPYLLDLEQAQQTVQDVFVSAYNDRNFQSQKFDEKKLLRIAVHHCRRQFLHGRGHPVVAEDSLISLFNGMAPLKREIMLLHHYMELPENDIACVCCLPLFVIRRTISSTDQVFAGYLDANLTTLK